jgi:Uma2 family endonuclease
MSTAAPTRMTVEEFLELPEDGVERWLIDGTVREFESEVGEDGMTRRNRTHSYLMTRLGRFLDEWSESQPEPRGMVVAGEAGVRFARDKQTSVGVDLAYISGELTAKQPDDFAYVLGVPTLVVEILSPNDKQKDVADKVRVYLKAGVNHVWVVDPDFPSVRVHRPNAKPSFVDGSGVLAAEPDMPGLKIDLKRVFRR